MAREGGIPVVVEYFFDDGISRERVRAQRQAWRAHLRAIADAVRGPWPVLVLLAPEFNDAPPEGETPITRWRGFGGEIAAALRIFRQRAPNARVGVCAGDFSPDRDLGVPLGRVARQLDFLAFQEMRATTDPDAAQRGYLDVGSAALSYARYLRREFGRPVLLGYVAVSSHGGWGPEQQDAISSLLDREAELLEAGVFGAIWFQLRDDPAHRGYFGPAERGFGLLDARGRPSPPRRSGGASGRRRRPGPEALEIGRFLAFHGGLKRRRPGVEGARGPRSRRIPCESERRDPAAASCCSRPRAGSGCCC